MRVVISGYYGFGNLGDEAILAAMLSALRARLPSAQFIVLSADPIATARTHQVHAVGRMSPAAVGALAGAELFISGGGSLIQDTTSGRSALYYLGILALATGLSRRTMIFAQGVGPLRRRWLRVLCRHVLTRVSLITLRDEDSQRLLAECGVPARTELVADPAFAVEAGPAPRGETMPGEPAEPRIGVVVRSVGDNAYLTPLAEAVDGLRRDVGGSVAVLAFHPARDRELCETFAAAVGGRIVSGLSPQQMRGVVGSLDLLVGVRLHALIDAVVSGVIPVGLSYDPKVDGLFRRIGVGYVLPVANLTAAACRQALRAAWEQRQAVRPQLLTIAAGLRADALRTADLAAALVALPPAQARHGLKGLRAPSQVLRRNSR